MNKLKSIFNVSKRSVVRNVEMIRSWHRPLPNSKETEELIRQEREESKARWNTIKRFTIKDYAEILKNAGSYYISTYRKDEVRNVVCCAILQSADLFVCVFV